MKEERAREIYKKVKDFAWNNTDKQEEFWRTLLNETTPEDRKDIYIFLDNDFTEFSFISETPNAPDDTCRCLIDEKDGVKNYCFYLSPGIYWQNVHHLLNALGFTAEPA